MTPKFLPSALLALLATALPSVHAAPTTAPSQATAASQPAPGARQAAAAQAKRDQALDRLSEQFLAARWQASPDAAIEAGKYEGAPRLVLPTPEERRLELAFYDHWLKRFAQIDPAKLSPKQATDHALVVNHLESSRWYLTTLREHEWNPSQHNVSSAIDKILSTEYAPKEQRLRALHKRLAQVPAFYAAARATISKPAREHTQLAISQNIGTLSLLQEVEKTAAGSALPPAEKQSFALTAAAAKVAVEEYIAWLRVLDVQLAKGGARSFRLGKELYDVKFGYDIQSGYSAEQLYQRARTARDTLLGKMDALSDELWPKVMKDAAKPADRLQKIGMVIDRLSDNHVAPEKFVDEVRRQIPELQAWITKHNLLTIDPNKPLVVRETPVYQRGVAGAGVDSPGPYRPQDNTYYMVAPPAPELAESSLREYNHWMLQILNIHEAIPGHYTQKVFSNKSPSIIKTLLGNGAMVEGWAVYGEKMMLESGYGGNEPEMWLMWYKWNLRSVTNVLLDYSTHVLGLSEAEAIHMLTKEAFQTHAEAIEKWKRVQLTSVQLTSYYSGFAEIVELREKRRQMLGDKFDLKAFHEQFLSYGSAPVKMISTLMLAP